MPTCIQTRSCPAKNDHRTTDKKFQIKNGIYFEKNALNCNDNCSKHV